MLERGNCESRLVKLAVGQGHSCLGKLFRRRRPALTADAAAKLARAASRGKLRYLLPTTLNSASTTDYEQYGYDENGNVTSLRRRNGQTVTLGYDNLDRLVSRTHPVTADNISFSYDLLGRRLAANMPNGDYNITYGWDNAGRLTNVWPSSVRRQINAVR